MTKRSKDEKPTDFRREEQDISKAERKLREKGRRVIHPGTVRVTIFPNPRVSTDTEKDGNLLKNRRERRGKREGAPSRFLAET